MSQSSPKPRYPRDRAIAVARELCGRLAPLTFDLRVAGSLRRGKLEVGDVELVFIPRTETRPVDLLRSEEVDLVAELLDGMLAEGLLAKREGESGHTAWGPKNKLAVHVGSGMPVDFFTASRENWWNYLVCRTGPRESNERIAVAAQAMGWQWNPYREGFTRIDTGEVHAVESEEAVFAFVGLPYRAPNCR